MAKKKSTKPASPPAARADLLPDGYEQWLRDIKDRVRQSQLRAATAVNRELIELYWQIGKGLAKRQQLHRWGNSVIDRLGEDLQRAFPGLGGFSRTNVYRMRAFDLAYRAAEQVVPQLVGQSAEDGLPRAAAEIPWGHNVVLIERVKDPAERLWYARAAVEHGWSRAVLTLQIESGLFRRQGKAVTNFEATLPDPQSDLARQLLKDPYNFDFLTLGDDARERELELELGLLEHIRSFLLELGVGFAFVANQYRLEVGGEDFSIDLLFYHLKLRSFVVIELKTTEFRPEYAGKMNFYLSAVDDLVRHPDDSPSIGLILCKAKDKVMAEYALRDMGKPIGVSGFQLAEALPESLQGQLPTIADLEAELSEGTGPSPTKSKPGRKRKSP